jgi:hypothetical protein
LKLIIPIIQSNYKVLKIDGFNSFTYHNNYFDTKKLKLYFDHHNGFSRRIKVRSRKYLETNTSFFEIKQKEKVDRTSKFRIQVDEIVEKIDTEKKDTIQSFLTRDLKKMKLVLKNNFNRITFVNHQKTERMTLDYNIEFSNLIIESLSKFILERYGYTSNIIKDIEDMNYLKEGEFETSGILLLDQEFDTYIQKYGSRFLYTDPDE